MKSISKILASVATLALLATGCVNEDPAYKKNENSGGSTSGSNGFLALGDTSFRVIYDADTDAKDENTGAESQATRATTPDVETFLVEIIRLSDNSTIVKKSYAELKTQLSTPLELEVGSYRINVRSEEVAATPAVEWEHPVYGATRDFAITKGQTTTIDEIVCTLQNIKVTLLCSIDLIESLTTTSTTTISLGETAKEFALNESRAAFFMPIAELNTLNFKLQGAFKDMPDKAVSFSKSIPNVKAGQWRKITLVITHANNGGISFDIKVENFVLDEEITVNGSTGLWEQIIDEEPEFDPTAPTIVWADHDMSQTFQLKSTMFSTNETGNTVCTEPFKFNLTSPNGVKSFKITISSDNTDFTSSLGSMGLGETFDLCAMPTSVPAYSVFKLFGFPMNENLRDQTAKSFDIGGAMPMLYLDPGFNGTHTFTFEITDKNGLATTESLKLLVDKDNESGEVTPAPTIVWTGYDIDKQYTVTSDMTLEIVASAPGGIKSMVVNIISDALNAKELAGVGIPAKFDLCNVEGLDFEDPNEPDKTPEEVAANLKALGFPVNDEIKGKTDPVTFNITQFRDMLLMVAKGNNNFELTVTDLKGQTLTKTLKLFVPTPEE